MNIKGALTLMAGLALASVDGEAQAQANAGRDLKAQIDAKDAQATVGVYAHAEILAQTEADIAARRADIKGTLRDPIESELANDSIGREIPPQNTRPESSGIGFIIASLIGVASAVNLIFGKPHGEKFVIKKAARDLLEARGSLQEMANTMDFDGLSGVLATIKKHSELIKTALYKLREGGFPAAVEIRNELTSYLGRCENLAKTPRENPHELQAGVNDLLDTLKKIGNACFAAYERKKANNT